MTRCPKKRILAAIEEERALRSCGYGPIMAGSVGHRPGHAVKHSNNCIALHRILHTKSIETAQAISFSKPYWGTSSNVSDLLPSCTIAYPIRVSGSSTTDSLIGSPLHIPKHYYSSMIVHVRVSRHFIYLFNNKNENSTNNKELCKQETAKFKLYRPNKPPIIMLAAACVPGLLESGHLLHLLDT